MSQILILLRWFVQISIMDVNWRTFLSESHTNNLNLACFTLSIFFVQPPWLMCGSGDELTHVWVWFNYQCCMINWCCFECFLSIGVSRQPVPTDDSSCDRSWSFWVITGIWLRWWRSMELFVLFWLAYSAIHVGQNTKGIQPSSSRNGEFECLFTNIYGGYSRCVIPWMFCRAEILAHLLVVRIVWAHYSEWFKDFFVLFVFVVALCSMLGTSPSEQKTFCWWTQEFNEVIVVHGN